MMPNVAKTRWQKLNGACCEKVRTAVKRRVKLSLITDFLVTDKLPVKITKTAICLIESFFLKFVPYSQVNFFGKSDLFLISGQYCIWYGKNEISCVEFFEQILDRGKSYAEAIDIVRTNTLREVRGEVLQKLPTLQRYKKFFDNLSEF